MKSGKKVKRYLKSILGTGLALSMVLSAFPTLANTEKDDAEDENSIIFSCGFEDEAKLTGTAKGETAYDGSFPEAYTYNTYSMSNDAHTGSHSLHIKTIGDANSNKRDSRVPFKVSLDGNKYYKISGYFKFDKASFNAYKQEMEGNAWETNSLLWAFSTEPNGGYKPVYASSVSNINDYTKYLTVNEWVPDAARTTLSSSDWTKVETVVKSDAKGDYYFWISSNDVNNAGKPIFLFADDIEVSEVTPKVVVSGMSSVDIPAYGSESVIAEYKADVMFSDAQSLAYESANAEYNIETSYKGIEFNSDEKKLIVTDKATSGTVNIKFESVNGFEGTYPVTIIAKTSKPEARNFKITVDGDKIIASYEYYDPNEKAENDTEIKWYESRDNGATYSIIEGANNSELVLSEELKNVLIKAEITPKNTDGVSGDTLQTKAFAFNHKQPIASNLKISGEMQTDAVLTADFDYYDPNSDEPGEHIYKWYKSLDGKNFELIDNEKKNYVLKDYDEGSYIKVQVTPVSSKEPYIGQSVESDVYGPVGARNTELALNGGFENTDLLTNTGYDGTYPGVSASNVKLSLNTDPDYVYSGDSSLYVTVESGQRTEGITFTPRVKKNTLYVLSFKIKKGNMGVNPYICSLKGTSIFVDNLSELDKNDEYGTTNSHIYVEGERFIDVNKVFFVPDASGSTEETNANLRMVTGIAPSSSPVRCYIDELSISEASPRVKIGDGNVILIPKEGEAAKTIDCTPKTVLKDGREFKIANNKISLELKENYPGVSLTDNVLKISDGAANGIIYIVAKNPNYCIEKTIPIQLLYDGDAVPMIKNAHIKGDVTEGAELKAEYTYFHGKNVAEDKLRTKYQWQFCETENGTYSDISEADKETYTVPSGSANGFYKVKIVTYDIDGNESAQVVTEAALQPVAPTANNVSVSGKHSVGAEVTASYVFEDRNYNTEKDSIYKWYVSDSKDGKYTQIDGENTLNYTIKESDCGKYIKFSVIPKSDEEPNDNKEYFSESFEGPVAPTAENVRIIGDGKEGGVLSVSYEYNHKYDVKEAANRTVINWYSGSEKFASGTSINVTSDMVGKSIYAGVIPYAEEMPYAGAEVKSASVTISGSGSNGHIGGGGGRRGNSGSGNQSGQNNSNNTNQTGNNGTFSDISEHWARQTIENMAKQNIVSGVGDGKFEPDREITRAEFCTIVCRAFDINNNDAGNVFTDVESGSWYEKYVNAAAKAGIVKGADGYFRPDDNINREEIASIMMNILKYKNYELNDTEATLFADEDEISDWAKEAVEKLSGLGLLKGKDNGFKPKDNATRAEAATVIERLIQLIKL